MMGGTMCLAIPGKVVSVEDNVATVDYGGLRREVNVSLVDVETGLYVLVHAGYAIQVMEEEEAQETLSLWNEMLSRDREIREK